LCILGKTCRSRQVEAVKKEVEKDESIECGRVETGAKISVFSWGTWIAYEKLRINWNIMLLYDII